MNEPDREREVGPEPAPDSRRAPDRDRAPEPERLPEPDRAPEPERLPEPDRAPEPERLPDGADEEPPSPEEEERVEAIAEAYLASLRAGEPVERGVLVAAHADIARPLSARLRLVELLHEAASEPEGAEPEAREGGEVRFACPHCRHPQVLVSPAPRPVTCSSCGGTYRLIAPPRAGEPEAARELLGPFELLELLGQGAFGAVYKARDRELDRIVTVKVPRAGAFESAEEEERFLREARAAASLQHPGIVAVHEIVVGEGTPFIVQEYVEGETLARALEERRLTFAESAEIVAAVAGALDHAHRRGVVHRDVKPENIILDRAGAPHLADFGLAHRDDREVTVTLDGQILGTPAYMAPEQASGRHDLVGGRSDVYSLGVVLYELLTGARPFQGQRSQVIYRVIHEEPTPPRRLDPRVPRDLETICLKAMAKEIPRRYARAAGLAADLRRFLAGETILARPAGRVEKLWRWCRRNPLVASLAAAVAGLLVAAAVASVWTALRFRRQAEVELVTRLEVTRQLARRNVLTGLERVERGDLTGSLPYFVAALSTDRAAGRSETPHRMRIAAVLARAPRLVAFWSHPAPTSHGAFSPDGLRVATACEDGKARVWEVASGELAGAPLEHPAAVLRVAFSADGRRLATGCADGRARVWNLESGRLLFETPPQGGAVVRARFDPEGRRLLSASTAGAAAVWSVQERSRLLLLRHRAAVTDACFSPGGDRILTASRDRTAVVWDAGSGERIATVTHRAAVNHAVFSPSGDRIATASDDHEVGVWDAATGEPRLSSPPSHGLGALWVEFGPEGRRIVSASWENSGRVWDAASGEPISPRLDDGYSQSEARFSSDGRRVLTTGEGGSATVWDADSGEIVAGPLRHERALNHAELGPEGHRVLAVGRDGTVRVWDIARGQPRRPPLLCRGGIQQVRFDPRGERVLTASSRGSLRIWDAPTSRPLTPWFYHRRMVWNVVFSPDGSKVATASWDKTAAIWDSRSARKLHELSLRSEGWCVRFSPGGRLLVTTESSGEVRLWEVATGRATGFVAHHRAQCRTATFSPDGRLVASGGHDGTARVWDVETAEPRTPPLRHGSYVYLVDFDPSGERLLSAGQDGAVRVWSATSGERLLEITGHGGPVRCARFSPDGRRIATASSDGGAVVWDSRTGEKLSRRMSHRTACSRVCFGPGGELVATASSDHTGRIWDAATGDAITPPLRHRDKVLSIAIDPLGRRAATAGADGEAQVWDLPRDDRPVEELARLAELLSGRRIDPHGSLEFVDRETLRADWLALRARDHGEFASQPEEALAWHWREAAGAEAAEDWRAAIAHLDRMILAEPDRWELHNRRGYAYRRLGRWTLAARDGATALQLRLRDALGALERPPARPAPEPGADPAAGPAAGPAADPAASGGAGQHP